MPIEEPHCLDNPTQVVKVNSLYRYDKAEIPPTKIASQCLDEFDNFMVKQEDFNAYFGRKLKNNSNMLEHLGDYMANVKGELKLISKHASMVTTQVEQVLKAKNDFLNELNSKKNDNAVRVMTRGGKMTQNLCILRAILRELSKILREIILMHLVLLRGRKRKMIELCMLLVNLL